MLDFLDLPNHNYLSSHIRLTNFFPHHENQFLTIFWSIFDPNHDFQVFALRLYTMSLNYCVYYYYLSIY